MKRPRRLMLAGLAGLTASLVWLFAQSTSPAAGPLGSLFPPGAILYLEAKDFQGLLADWNSSNEKKTWLGGDSYQVFSRSNLFTKLQSAQTEFATAAGVPPDMAFLDTAAGSESALAFYDIGKLQFLYITRMPTARVTASALWKLRGNYEPRKSESLDYFIRYDKASDRTAAFAVAKDYLLLATREDALAGALALLSGHAGAAITAEPWFSRPVQAAKTPGELRLVLNMPRLMQSPYMRSYWIQRNASDLKQYEAAIADLSRAASEIREDRVLLRATTETPAWNEAAVAQALRLVPTDTGLYRAYASPSAQEALDRIREKIVQPSPGTGPQSQMAPGAGSPDATAGTEADLETRIDEPPLEPGNQVRFDDLRKLLEATRLDAMLEIGSTRVLPDGVFVDVDSAVVLQRTGDWDLDAVRSALGSAGASLNGPAPIGTAARGGLLVLSNRAAMADAILASASKPATASGARYIAVYRHSRELPTFERMFRLIDNPLKNGNEPMFFSQTLASLGGTLLGRVDSASMVVHDSGAEVRQSLVYKWKP